MGAGKKWYFALFAPAFVSLMLLLRASYYTSRRPFVAESATPRPFAYYISGDRGDPDRIFWLLLAVYHPRNRYLLHIGADGSNDERQKLAGLVKSVAAIRYFTNVDVMGKLDPSTYMGSTTVVATLHAVAVLLKVDGGWDWLITLRATDYPLLTQDGLKGFSQLWLIQGFNWQGGSKYFTPHKNGQRRMLLRSSQDYPPKMEPLFLNTSDYEKMVQSGAAFARKFHNDNPALDVIDKKILNRHHNRAAPGAWCSGRKGQWMDPCSRLDNLNGLKPGPQAKRFQESITKLLGDWNAHSNQCK